MSKKSSSKTTSQQTVTATPTNPDWVTQSSQGLQTRINGLLDVDPRSLVPGTSPLQNQAFGAGAGLIPGAPRPPTSPIQGPQGPVADTFDPSGQVDRTAFERDRAASGIPDKRTYMAEHGFGPDRPSSSFFGGHADPAVPAQGADGGLLGWRDQLGTAQDAATGLLGPVGPAAQAGATDATSHGLLDVNLDGYTNPWQKDVIDTTLASRDEQTGMDRAQLAAQQARGAKFSGSGDAITRSLFERGALQDRTGVEAQLRSQGHDRATELANADLNREADTSRFNAGQRTGVSQFNTGQANAMDTTGRAQQLQATGLLGDLANSGGAGDRADIGLLSGLGDEQRQIEGQQNGANAEMLKLIASLNAQQPYNLYRGQTTDAVGSGTSKGKEYGLGNTIDTFGNLLQGAGSAASGAAALGFSDKRLKAGIRKEGRDTSGRPVVSYRYKGEPERVRRIGYLAQDLEKTDPHAVVRGPGGYRMVDYGLLGEAA